MRRVLACVIPLLAVLGACAGYQIVPPEGRSLQQVREISLSKDQIFDRSLEWMAQTFVDSKAVIELKDKENGKIIGKGVTSIMAGGIAYVPCRFTIMIEARDGKYRTTYSNFIGLWEPNRSSPLEYKTHIDEVKANLAHIDESLYTYLKSPKSGGSW